MCDCSHSVLLCPPWSGRWWALLSAGRHRWPKGRGARPVPWPRLTSRLLSSLRPQESISSSGTPHKRDSFIYSTWLEDSVSTTSGGSSPGTRLEPLPRQAGPCLWPEGSGLGTEGGDHVSCPRWWVCRGGVIIEPKMTGWLGGLIASGRVLAHDGGEGVKKGVRVGYPGGGTWQGWGAPTSADHPSIPVSLVPPRGQ